VVEDGHRTTRRTWAAPPGPFDDPAAELEGPRWVIAGEAYLGQLWAGQGARRVTPSGWLWSSEAQQELRALRAIDFFGDLGQLAVRQVISAAPPAAIRWVRTSSRVS
jgi:hypothetical protein